MIHFFVKVDILKVIIQLYFKLILFKIGRKILFRVGLAILDSATTILLDCNTTKQLKHTLNSVGSHFGNISPIMKV